MKTVWEMCACKGLSVDTDQTDSWMLHMSKNVFKSLVKGRVRCYDWSKEPLRTLVFVGSLSNIIYNKIAELE